MGSMVRQNQSPILAGITFGVLVTPPRAGSADTHAGSEARAPEPGQISTQGYGELRVRPDSFRTSLGVEAQAETLEKARSEVNARMQQVTDALKGLEIEGLTLQTETLQISPVYDQPREGGAPPAIVGYRAANSLSAELRGASRQALGDVAAQVVDAAVSAGANEVRGIQFFVEDAAKERLKALQAAVTDAERNARAMAEIAQVELAGVKSIDGAPDQGGPLFRAFDLAAREAGAPSTPIETGETVISSRVTATFAFRLPR